MNIIDYLKSIDIETYLEEADLQNLMIEAIKTSNRSWKQKNQIITELKNVSKDLTDFSLVPYSYVYAFNHYNLSKFYYKKITKDVTVYTNKKETEYVIFSLKKGLFQYVKRENSANNSFITKPYHIQNILSYELIRDDYIVKSNGMGVGMALVGGLLFGGTGAIAGALTQQNQNTNKTKNDYAIRLKLDDIELASIEIKCDDRDTAHRLLSTFELWESKISKT